MIEGGYKPREWKLAGKVVYPSGVEWAIKTFEPYKPQENMGFIPYYYKRDSSI
jgi:hypothetical protein